MSKIRIALIDSGVNDNDLIIETDFSNSGSLKDKINHGTRMAEKILDRAQGSAKIISLKVIDDDGSASIDNMTRAVKYAISYDVDIISIPLAAEDVGNTKEFKQAIRKALNEGIKVIASAGNYHEDASNYIPANIDGVIDVGALDENGKRQPFSNEANYYVKADSTSAACAYMTATMAKSMYMKETKFYPQDLHCSISASGNNGLITVTGTVDSQGSNSTVSAGGTTWVNIDGETHTCENNSSGYWLATGHQWSWSKQVNKTGNISVSCGYTISGGYWGGTSRSASMTVATGYKPSAKATVDDWIYSRNETPTGVFFIHYSGTLNGPVAPTWSTANGQDDIKWYGSDGKDTIGPMNWTKDGRAFNFAFHIGETSHGGNREVINTHWYNNKFVNGSSDGMGGISNYRRRPMLTLNANGGTGGGSAYGQRSNFKVTLGTNATAQFISDNMESAIPAVSRTGYDFLGWYTAASGGNFVNTIYLYNDSTYYAHWAIKTSTGSIQARWQKQDGSWTDYFTVWQGTVNYGSSYTWTQAADNNFVGGSATYKYGDEIVQVSIPRKDTAKADTSIWLNDNGTWQRGITWVNNNGTWEKVKQIEINDGGTWQNSN